jgi:S-adenosylmethionine:tRNA ribosyltransferase-isomerase
VIVAAEAPAGRRGGKLLVIRPDGGIRSGDRRDLAAELRPGDLFVANDAATIPASLAGAHEPTGLPVEVRLAGRRSLRPDDVRGFTALVFGEGDWHTPTEHRAAPPPLAPGDRLRLGPLRAVVAQVLGHQRLVELGFEGEVAEVWAGIVSHGRPIQYTHVPEALALWDVWTPVAAHPVAFEPPSAGFALSWSLLERLGALGVGFATLTHAAGLSSTGDATLDARLPLEEAYHIPLETVRRIRRTRRDGGRVIAVGTTVVRALEHSALETGAVRSGEGLATGRIGPDTVLRTTDGILTGVHETATSHYQLLRAFASDATLAAANAAMEDAGYRLHEFGDSVLVLRS